MKMKKFFWWLLFLGFLFFSAWLFFFSYFTQIKKVDVKGNFANISQVENFLENWLRGRNWRYFPRDNFFLFSSRQAEKSLREQFPLIKEIFWQKKFPDQLAVTLIERQGVFIWCFEEECFWVDNSGVLFWGPQSLSEAEKSNYLWIKGNSDSEAKVGKAFLTPQVASFILDLGQKIKESDQFGQYKEIFSPDQAAEELRVNFVDGWWAYFSLKQSWELQLKTLEKILQEKLQVVPRDKIEYIDLRLSGKAIYKLKE